MENKLESTRWEAEYSRRSALIICTRNRHKILEATLGRLRAVQLPELIVIVDSSDTEESEAVIRASWLSNRVIYLRSERGLPHQRNVGILHLRRLGLTNIDFVSFLDDDVIPSVDYFLNCHKLFQDAKDAVCIGGFDVNLETTRPKRVARILGIIPKFSGGVAKSGFTSVAIPNARLCEVDWVPGGMQNLSWEVVANCMFDGRIEFFGEDVEMHLRISKRGPIYVSNSLAVEHLSGQVDKPPLFHQKLCQSKFRWWLAGQYPERVTRTMVVLGSFALVAQSLFGFTNASRGERLTGLRAEAAFLISVFRRDVGICASEHLALGPKG